MLIIGCGLGFSEVNLASGLKYKCSISDIMYVILNMGFSSKINGITGYLEDF